jgi:hypothetical protein
MQVIAPLIVLVVFMAFAVQYWYVVVPVAVLLVVGWVVREHIKAKQEAEARALAAREAQNGRKREPSRRQEPRLRPLRRQGPSRRLAGWRTTRRGGRVTSTWAQKMLLELSPPPMGSCPRWMPRTDTLNRDFARSRTFWSMAWGRYRRLPRG